MKTTIERIFKTDADAAWWQQDNCLECTKAVQQDMFSTRQYKCALQRDIECQMAGFMDVNVRSFNMIHGCKVCPLLKPKHQVNDIAPDDVPENEFAKGETMVGVDMGKGDDKTTTAIVDTTTGKTLPTTCEKCATTNGNAAGGIVDRKEYETPPQSPQTPNGGNKTVGSDFDRWQMNDIRYRMNHNGKGIEPIGFVPGINGEMMNIQPFDEEMFRRRVSSDVRVMMEKFTPNESMKMAFVPLVLTEIAWMYADRCMKWCAEHRVSATVKLCRAMKQLRKDYIAYLAKDLKPDHIQNVIDQAHEFHDSIATKFQVMWYTLNGEWSKTYPDDAEYNVMRTDALMGMVCIKALERHNKQWDDRIRKEFGREMNSITDPKTKALFESLDAFTPDCNIEWKGNIDMCVRVVYTQINLCDFDLV